MLNKTLVVHVWSAILIILGTLLAVALAIRNNDLTASLSRWNAQSETIERAIHLERIARANPRNTTMTAVKIRDAAWRCGHLHGVAPALMLAVAHVESTFYPLAVGGAGERGLYQFTRSTARELGLAWESAFDIDKNTCAAAAYLAQHLRDYGSVERAVKRYNGGGDPNYLEKVGARMAP